MNTVIIYPNPVEPFNVVVVHPAYNDRWTEQGALELARLDAHAISDETAEFELDVLPLDHPCDAECPFFNAWRWDGVAITTDMAVAREIHHSLLLHAVYQQIDWAGAAGNVPLRATLLAIQATLHGAPRAVDQIDNPADLEAYWPEGLGREH